MEKIINRFLKFISSALAATLLLLPVFGQTNSNNRITGQVLDNFDSVIRKAEVSLLSENYILQYQSETDDEGKFTFAGLKLSSYILLIKKEGFSELRRVVKINENDRAKYKLEIMPTVETVTVTALRGEPQNIFDAPESINTARFSEIRQRPGFLLPLALREEPGLHIQQTTTSQGSVFVRGLTGQHVLNLVNGVRFNNSTMRPGANQYLAFIDSSFVDQIEVLRGAGSTQYGSDSLGGTVNVITRTLGEASEKFKFNADAEAVFGSADLSTGGALRFSGGNWRWGFSAEAAARRVQDLRPGKGIDSRSVVTRLFGLSSKILGDDLQNTRFTQYGANLKQYFNLTERDSFSFEYINGTQRGVQRYDQLDGGLGNLISGFDPQILDFFTARYDRAKLGFLDSASLTFSFNGQRDDRTSQSINNSTTGLRSKITDEYNRTNVFGYQAQATTALGSRNTLTFGAEFYDEKIISKRTDFAFNPVNNDFSIAATVRARFPNNSVYRSAGIFVQDIFTFIPERLIGSFGIRYSNFYYRQTASQNPTDAQGRQTVPDFATRFGDTTFNVGLMFKPTSFLSLTANLNRGFRAPNVNDFGSIGLSGIGFEITPEESERLGGHIGNFNSSLPPADSKPIRQLLPEYLYNYEIGARLQTSLLSGSVTFFNSEFSNFIERRTVILAHGAVGQLIGGQPIIRQDSTGAVFTALSNSPVFVRANAGRLRLRGAEMQLNLKLTEELAVNANGFLIRGTDLERGVAPSLENGIPPATGFAGIRWEPFGKRFWVEAYSNFADAQRRFSDNDFQQARIGGIRTRSEIANFFNNGAIARGLVQGGILLATGETLAQVQQRVLGSAQRAPLYTKNPGFATANFRGGYRFNDRSSLTFILENILDKNYRTMGSGIDAPGINAAVRYSYKF